MASPTRPVVVRPPFAPQAFQRLLTRSPSRAAAVLLAMRPRAYLAQAQAQAVMQSVSLVQIISEWAALLSTRTPPWSPIDAADSPHQEGAVDPRSLAAPMIVIARADARDTRP